ncbi:hypothetical protein [Novosphingobium sp. LASN5T]|uniref:hypothetical protein n=1 Tax=Novosphingobium sp. LASN5T TaxID=2491021 RepID=UPI000F601910|nr:hypothetical protein [Novosphingobium sp. LASN5T]RQW44676.1 hypothetical protein EH199_08055 [Novosphingobium sp. LASN5T]
MTDNQGHMPNRAPTAKEIERETLSLDAYGMKVSDLLSLYPVRLDASVRKQLILNPLIDAMAEEGWLFAGSGFFSAVFIKGGLALKIGFKVTDTGAMYAAWCRANQGKPGVPLVYSLSKFVGCYVILQRRYDKLETVWLDEEDEHFLRDVADEYGEIKTALNVGGSVFGTRYATVRTAAQIREFFEGIVDWDVHHSNVMMDDSGELIITDPISYGPCSDADDGYSYASNSGYYGYAETSETL